MEFTTSQLEIINEALQGMRGRLVQEGNQKGRIVDIVKVLEIINSQLDK